MGGRSRIINLDSPSKTTRFGCHAARLLPLGSILALRGPLGAGKTSFVQGLAEGLNIHAPIQSPTFSYLNLYEENETHLYHFDLYRMKNPSDFFAMGFEEYFDRNGIIAIEWPERLGSSLPAKALSFQFSYSDSGRNVHLSSAFETELIDLLAAWD